MTNANMNMNQTPQNEEFLTPYQKELAENRERIRHSYRNYREAFPDIKRSRLAERVAQVCGVTSGYVRIILKKYGEYK